MNKNQIENKNNLFIVGSPFGVNRFYAVNRIMELLPDAKIISTGRLIASIISDFSLEPLDRISITDYYKYVEPIFIKEIMTHLEHEDVVLDTCFHYLVPAISLNGLLKFNKKIKKAFLILVNDNAENIYIKNQSNSNPWFRDITKIDRDVISNQYFFDFYNQVFSEICKVSSIKINSEGDIVKINEMAEEFKNGNGKNTE